MSFEQAEADRRIHQIVQVGVVTSVSGGKATVKIGDIETPPLPVGQLAMGNLRIKTMPSVGEQRQVFAPGGDLSRAQIGLAIAAGNTPDDEDEHMVLDLGGAEFRIVGNLVVDGDVIARGVSLTTHTHPGVTAGSASTEEPN